MHKSKPKTQIKIRNLQLTFKTQNSKFILNVA